MLPQNGGDDDPEISSLSLSQKYEQYDPYKRPPNIDIARNHGQATIYGKIRSTQVNIEKCPCCGQPVLVDSMNLCCSHKELSCNGPGVCLYFDFILFCICILSIYGLVAGIYNITQNANGNRCDIESQDLIKRDQYICYKNFYDLLALTNRTKFFNILSHSTEDPVGDLLNLISTILIMVASLYYKKRITKVASDIDQATISVADYSIMVSNLPSEFTEQDIHKYFSINEKDPNGITALKKISLGYKIGPYLQLKTELLQKKKKLEDLTSSGDQEQMIQEQLHETIITIQNKMNTMVQDTSVLKFSGVCFISYATQLQSNDIQEFYKASFCQIIKRQFFRIFKIHSDKVFRGKSIEVKRAPEPSDIIWHNLGASIWEQWIKRIITSIALSFVLYVCLYMIVHINLLQIRLTNDKQIDQAQITFLGLIASSTIIVINLVLAIVIQKLAVYEKHNTQTEFMISVAKKLGLAQFINTAILIFVITSKQMVSSSEDDILTQFVSPGGLNHNVNIIMITNVVVALPQLFFDPLYFVTLYKRRQILQQGASCTLNQQQANNLFEGTNIDLELKYAQVAKTLLLTFFYAYLLPIGVFLGILSLICQYWVEKVILLRRNQRPIFVSDELAHQMVDFYINLTLIVFSLGCPIWQTLDQSEMSFIAYIQLILVLMFYILPMEQIFKSCLSFTTPLTTLTYEQTKHVFWDDYDRRNPLTMQKAEDDWVNNNDIEHLHKKQQMNDSSQRNKYVYNFEDKLNNQRAQTLQIELEQYQFKIESNSYSNSQRQLQIAHHDEQQNDFQDESQFSIIQIQSESQKPQKSLRFNTKIGSQSRY